MSTAYENRQFLKIAAILAILMLPGFSLGATSDTDYKIDRQLMKKLADDEEAIGSFFVVFGERPDLSQARKIKSKAARGRFVVQALKDTAEGSQNGVIGYLKGHKADFTAFWVENKIYVRNGTLELARGLAKRQEVVAILPEVIYSVPQPRISGDTGTQGIEWNIARIGADQVWTQYAAKGGGFVVANIDTGVQYDHPALVRQYRGYTGSGYSHTGNWKDPANVCGGPSPCDNHGHGTHTMGTMVGNDGVSNLIGVVPEARWIACKGCESGSCSGFSLITCAQWIMDPNENLSGAGQPDVVNNSWGGGSGNSWYRSYVQNWRAAGIFPAFSIGNSGPKCNTANTPGDYPESFASGATGSSDTIASFSSRGPSAFGGIIKPNVSAPGVGIRSSVPTNGYSSWSGTSMASPHTAAAAALLWSVDSSYQGNIGATEQILQQTAAAMTTSESCGGVSGAAIPNNTYGYGRLNVKAAADALGQSGDPPNQPPTVRILTPPNGASYNCGEVVSFSGSATDPDGPDLTSSMVWTDNGSYLGSGGSFTRVYSCTEVGNHNIVATATDSAGASDSDTITIAIVNASVPAAPSGLSAKTSGSTVNLTWTDNSFNEDGFQVERKEKQSKRSWSDWHPVANVQANATNYSESPGKGQYQYRVLAYKGSELSDPSNIASAKVK